MFPKNLNLEREIPSNVEGIPYTSEPPRPNGFEEPSPNFSALILIGAVLFVVGMGAMALNFAVAGAVAGLGFLMMIGGGLARNWHDFGYASADLDAQYKVSYGEPDSARDSWARAEARMKDVEEVVKTVKTMIRVRCRYCGMLNEEKANKCESCGGAL